MKEEVQKFWRAYCEESHEEEREVSMKDFYKYLSEKEEAKEAYEYMKPLR